MRWELRGLVVCSFVCSPYIFTSSYIPNSYIPTRCSYIPNEKAQWRHGLITCLSLYIKGTASEGWAQRTIGTSSALSPKFLYRCAYSIMDWRLFTFTFFIAASACMLTITVGCGYRGFLVAIALRILCVVFAILLLIVLIAVLMGYLFMNFSRR